MRIAGFRVLFRLVASCSLGIAGLYAQLNVSTLRGTATDPSGAAVPGVSVKVVNLETNFTRTVTTSSSGDYEIPDLSRGIYRCPPTECAKEIFRNCWARPL